MKSLRDYRFWNSGEPRVNAAACAAVDAFATVADVASLTSLPSAFVNSSRRTSSAAVARYGDPPPIARICPPVSATAKFMRLSSAPELIHASAFSE